MPPATAPFEEKPKSPVRVHTRPCLDGKYIPNLVRFKCKYPDSSLFRAFQSVKMLPNGKPTVLRRNPNSSSTLPPQPSWSIIHYQMGPEPGDQLPCKNPLRILGHSAEDAPDILFVEYLVQVPRNPQQLPQEMDCGVVTPWLSKNILVVNYYIS